MNTWMEETSLDLQQFIDVENRLPPEPDESVFNIPGNDGTGQLHNWSDESFEAIVHRCKKIYRFLEEKLLTLLDSGDTSFCVGEVRYFENENRGRERLQHPGNVTSIDFNMRLQVFNLSPIGGPNNVLIFFLHLLQSNSVQLGILPEAESFQIMKESDSIGFTLTNGVVVGLRLCSVDIPKKRCDDNRLSSKRVRLEGNALFPGCHGIYKAVTNYNHN